MDENKACYKYVKALEKYFDEIYICDSDENLDIIINGVHIHYKFECCKGEENSNTRVKFLCSSEVEDCDGIMNGIHICFYENEDKTVSKILFVWGYLKEFNFRYLPYVMNYYFELNKRFEYKVFDQYSIRDQFINQYLDYFCDAMTLFIRNSIEFTSNKDTLFMTNITRRYHPSRSVEFNSKYLKEASIFFEDLAILFED